MSPIGSRGAKERSSGWLRSTNVTVTHRRGRLDAGPEATWPIPALDRLVGPPGVTLGRFDLGWLRRLEALRVEVDRGTVAVGGPDQGPSALELLVERARLLDRHGWGPWSAGTSCRMVRALDGWLAVNLPREDDLDAVPALLDCSPGADPWSAVVHHVRDRRRSQLVARAELLGLAVAEVPDSRQRGRQRPPAQVRPAGPGRLRARPLVADLTSLWAGPLAGWYLARAGARVVKVESTRRPDGARRGSPAFYRRLNAGKELLDLDLGDRAGVEALRDLVAGADIVLEASRPRALRAFGLEPSGVVDRGGIWCSITGYGRDGPEANRVAFGDDAAAAGGLVTFVGAEPWFIGDAAADPIAGLAAAAAVLGLWADGSGGLVDVAMRDAVAHLTGGVPVAGAR